MSVYPGIYIPLSKAKKGDWLVSRETDIVIEGFPRSGNSYAEAAFRLSQHSDLKIAHHCHAAAQLIAAEKWKIPALVIIRNPIDACASLIRHEPELFTAEKALSEYVTFHRGVLRVREWCVVASFEAVIDDFGTVVRLVNKKYKCRFDVFDKSDSSKAFSLLDALSMERGTASEEGEPYSLSRSEEEKSNRENDKQKVRNEILDVSHKVFLDKAEKVYRSLYSVRDI